jgi:hypothetical protein
MPEMTMQERRKIADRRKLGKHRLKEERAAAAQVRREKEKKMDKNKEAFKRLGDLRQTLAFLENHKQHQLPVDFTYETGARVVIWKPGVEARYCDPTFYLPMFFAGLLEEEPYNQLAHKSAVDILSAIGDRVLLCFPECAACGILGANLFCNTTLATVCSMKCKKLHQQQGRRRKIACRAPVSLISVITQIIDFANTRQQSQLLSLVIVMIKKCPGVGEILAAYTPLLKSCNNLIYEEQKKIKGGRPKKQPQDPAMEKVEDVLVVLQQTLELISAGSQQASEEVKKNVPTFECFEPPRREWAYSRNVRVKRVNDGRYTFEGWRKVRVRQKRAGTSAAGGNFYVKFPLPYDPSKLTRGPGACILKLPFSTTKLKGLVDDGVWDPRLVDGLYDGLGDNKWGRLEGAKYVIEFERYERAPPEMLVAMPIVGVRQISQRPAQTPALQRAASVGDTAEVSGELNLRSTELSNSAPERPSLPTSLVSEKLTMRRLRQIFKRGQGDGDDGGGDDGGGDGFAEEGHPDVPVNRQRLLADLRGNTQAWNNLAILLGDYRLGGGDTGAILEELLLGGKEGNASTTISWAEFLSLCARARNNYYEKEQEVARREGEKARIQAKKQNARYIPSSAGA